MPCFRRLVSIGPSGLCASIILDGHYHPIDTWHPFVYNWNIFRWWMRIQMKQLLPEKKTKDQRILRTLLTGLETCWQISTNAARKLQFQDALQSKKSRLTCPFRAIAKIQQEMRPILLPGLNYTEWQQIWLAKTIFWCGNTKFSEESQRYQISKRHFDTDHHSTGAFRILGPFSNSAQFSKDWSCPKDSPMNPAEKCTLYGDDLWLYYINLNIAIFE